MSQNDKTKRQVYKPQVQTQAIQAFDKELFSYTGQIAWFLPSLFSFLLLILIAIPVQELADGGHSIGTAATIFSSWISFCILLPYVQVTDLLTPQKGKQRTYEKLRYLPVSRRQYRAVRMGYLFRYLWKLAAVGLILQCLVAVLLLKRMDFWNVVYPLAILFIWPLAVGWLQLQFDR